jgi:hypothetical protein
MLSKVRNEYTTRDVQKDPCSANHGCEPVSDGSPLPSLFLVAAREHQRREEVREEGDPIRCTVLSTPRATILTDLGRM